MRKHTSRPSLSASCVTVVLLSLVCADAAHALEGWALYVQSGNVYRRSVGGSEDKIYDTGVNMQNACWSAAGN